MDLELEMQKACRLGDIGAINMLVSQDRSLLDRFDENIGWNPLYRTVICGNVEATNSLLILGANPNLTNKVGDSPLHTAADNGYYRIAKEL
jgi:ankyrin repeat protein